MSYVHVTGLACVLKLCPSPFPSISMSASKWGDWELNIDILMAKICMCFLPYSSHVELSKMVTSIWYKIILKEYRLESWNAFMFSLWCLCKVHVFSKHIFLMSLYFSQVDEKSSFDISARLTLGLTLVFLPWSGMVESGVWQLQFSSLLWRACSAGGGFFVCKMRSVTQILPTAPPCPSLPQFWVNFTDVLVAQSCPTLCDPMNSSTPGLPVHHQLPEFTDLRKCSFLAFFYHGLCLLVVPWLG